MRPSGAAVQACKNALRPRRPYLWIIVAGLLLYSKTLSFDFTHLDDKQLIVDNLDFISDISNIPKAFQQKVFPTSPIPYYRPMLTLSLIFDAQLGGPNPFIYHLSNVIIHIMAACLLCTLLSMLGHNRSASLFISMIFTIHPVLAGTVAWVPGRNDLMLAAFALLSLISFLRYLERGGVPYLIAHAAFLAFSLFTKESAIVLIPLFVFYCYAGNGFFNGSKKLMFPAISWLGVTVLWFMARSAALSSALKIPIAETAASFAGSLPAVIQFIGKIIIPAGLSVFPTIRDTSFIYGAVSIILIAAAFLYSRHTDKKTAAFGFLWFISFLLVSFIRPAHQAVVDFQEHRLYVPMIGFAIMLLETDILKFIDLSDKRRLVSCAAAVLVFFLVSFGYLENFRDRFAYWANAARTSPSSSFVHLRLGFMHYLDGMTDKAEEEYHKSIALDAATPLAHLKLGILYMDKGMYEEAEKEFRKEIAVYPPSSDAYLSLGVICYKDGRHEEAEALWKRALEFDPDNKSAIKNLAIYYQEKNNAPLAVFYVKELKARGVTPPREFLESLGLLS